MNRSNNPPKLKRKIQKIIESSFPKKFQREAKDKVNQSQFLEFLEFMNSKMDEELDDEINEWYKALYPLVQKIYDDDNKFKKIINKFN